jgi:hypothetical protein
MKLTNAEREVIGEEACIYGEKVAAEWNRLALANAQPVEVDLEDLVRFLAYAFKNGRTPAVRPT